MALLTWKHGKSQSEAQQVVKEELRRLGQDGKVKWDGFKASASVGWWGALLHASGEITEAAIVLENCGGAFGGKVLQECRVMLERLFPGDGVPATPVKSEGDR